MLRKKTAAEEVVVPAAVKEETAAEVETAPPAAEEETAAKEKEGEEDPQPQTPQPEPQPQPRPTKMSEAMFHGILWPCVAFAFGLIAAGAWYFLRASKAAAATTTTTAVAAGRGYSYSVPSNATNSMWSDEEDLV